MNDQQPTTARNDPRGGRLPQGASHLSKSYYDESGRRHMSATMVPVDTFGRLAGRRYVCPKCQEQRWMPPKLSGTPVCQVDGVRLRLQDIKKAPLLPWGPLWRAADRPLRAVWAAVAVGMVGYAADTADVPGVVPAMAAIPAGLAAWRITDAVLTGRAVRSGRLVADDPTAGRRWRTRLDRRARTIGYCTAAGCGWTALAATAGMQPGTPGAAVSLLTLAAVSLPPAATWWRHLRDRKPEQAEQQPEPVVSTVEDTPDGPTEAQVRHIWSTKLACQMLQVTGAKPDGTPVVNQTPAPLFGTTLRDWRRIPGGWMATIVGEVGRYESDNFLAARGKIASAFSAKKSMVTILPDDDDENLATLAVQRVTPIKETPRWDGPGSIDVTEGTAPVLTYADGTRALYEIYRPGWGVPHVAAFGTTGSAKSSFLKLLFVVDRWAQHEGRGLVADFLIDPQQGQSYAEFLDELAAPPACTLDEAKLLIEALSREALRRNRYLAREAKTWDERRRKWRVGREWWNPLVDGPILAVTIDEAHDYLSNKEFATLVTKAGRMWRKCGMQLRIGTHTPLLADLGGNMALRDMLTGGFVWVGRTANSLSGPVAFNGRLPVDPRLIPTEPGMAYSLGGRAPKPMLARTMWEPDWYVWLRDDDDQPIGYPAILPPETVSAFGAEYAAWVTAMRAGDDSWTPSTSAKTELSQQSSTRSVEAVEAVLYQRGQPVDMDEIDAALRHAGNPFSTRTVRDALKKLRDGGRVFTSKGRHELTPQAREDLDATAAEERDHSAEQVDR